MPSVIPAIAGALVAQAVGVAVGSTIIGSIAGAIVATGVGRAMGLGKQPAAQTFQSVASGALVNTAGTMDSIPVIYGTRRVGGTRCLTALSGSSNEYLHLVYALAEGEISAIDAVYLDDLASTDSRYSGLVTLEKYVGSDSQTASAALIAALDVGSPSPGTWTTDHRGRGVAYVYAKLQYNQDAFGGLPKFAFDLDGRLLYDPRVAGSPTYYAFSDNPALAILDYLTHPRYGRGVPLGSVHLQSFRDAADYCDELVAIPAAGSPSTGYQKRYTCNGLLNPASGSLENMKALLTACRGSLVYSGGQFKLVLDQAQDAATGFEFTEDNIVGEWAIKLPGKRDKLNRVRARFFNPDRDWQPDVAVVESSTYRTEDNGLVLEREIDLPFTSNYYTAAQIAQIELKQSRVGITCRFRAVQEGLRCEVGDVVNITHSTPGWTEKPFRILAIEILGNDEVGITAREYAATVYDLDTLDLVDAPPATSLPNPFSVSAPTGLTFTQSTTLPDRGTLSWTAPADAFVSSYQVEYKQSADSEWTVLPLTRDTAFNLEKLQPARYNFRVKAYNNFGVSSSYATVTGDVVSHFAVTSYFGATDFLGQARLTGSASLSWCTNEDVRTMVFCPVNRRVYGVVNGKNPFYIDPDPTGAAPNPVELNLNGETFLSVAYDPGTQYLIFSQDRPGSPTPACLIAVDPLDHSIVWSANPTVFEIDYLFYCPGDGYIWGIVSSIGSAYVINPVNGALVAEITGLGLPQYAAYAPSSNSVYIGSGTLTGVRVISLTGSPSYVVTGSVLVGDDVTGVAYCGSEDRIVVGVTTGGGSIEFINPNTNAVTDTITTGVGIPGFALYVRENDRVYIFDTFISDKIYVVVPRTKAMRSSFLNLSGQYTQGCYSPADSRVYIGTDAASVHKFTV